MIWLTGQSPLERRMFHQSHGVAQEFTLEIADSSWLLTLAQALQAYISS